MFTRFNSFLFKSTADHLIVSIGNFLIIVLGAKILSPVSYGKLSIVISSLLAFQAIKMPLLYWGSFLYLKYCDDELDYQKNLANLSLLFDVIGSIGFFLIFFFFEIFSNTSSILLATFFIFFHLIFDHSRLEYYTFRSSRFPLRETLAVYFFRLILVNFTSDLNEFLFILAISNIFHFHRFFSLFSFKNLRKNLYSIIKVQFSLSKHMGFSSMLSWLWNYLPIFLIGIFHDVVLSGILLSIKSLSNIHHPISSLLDTFIPSKIYSKEITNIKSYLYGVGILIFSLWLIVFLFLYLYGEEILFFVFTENYSKYQFDLIILWIASGFHLFSKSYLIYLRWLEYLNIESKASFLSALVVILCSPLLYFYGTLGASVSYMLASVVFLIYVATQTNMARKSL